MASQRVLTLTTQYHLGAVAVSALLSWWLYPGAALGVLAGGLLIAINFRGLHVLGRKSLAGDRPRLIYLLGIAVKLALTLALMTLLVVVLNVHAVGFALGFLTLFVGMGLAFLHLSLTAREARCAENAQ